MYGKIFGAFRKLLGFVVNNKKNKTNKTKEKQNPITFDVLCRMLIIHEKKKIKNAFVGFLYFFFWNAFILIIIIHYDCHLPHCFLICNFLCLRCVSMPILFDNSFYFACFIFENKILYTIRYMLARTYE